MSHSKLFHGSSRRTSHGITLDSPAFYDVSTGVLFFGRRRRAYQTLLEAGGVRRGDRVLDVGSGPGYFARMIAEAVGPEGAVIGVDASPEMVGYATRKARHLPHCRFHQGTAQSLDLPDVSFDVVVSSLMLHHLPDEARIEAVREMWRVLRPGGTLVVAEFQIPERGAWHLVAALSGHTGMGREVSPVEPLVAQAGFIEARSGDAPPWLHYVTAQKRAAAPDRG